VNTITSQPSASVEDLTALGRTSGPLPEVMTAVVLTRHGGPDALEVRQNVPTPRLAAHEVLVAVAAAGMNNTDVWSRQGSYGTAGDPGAVGGWRGIPLSFPRIQGGDIAGRVVGVGTAVATTWLGRRVLVDSALYAADDANAIGLLGSEADGGFAQFAAVNAHRLHGVDDSPLSDEELAALPIAYGTAVGMLERSGLAAGERILVTGASGGVGVALVQLARARGCTVVAVTTETEDKREQVLRAGASRVLSRKAVPSQELDESVDVVADVNAGAFTPVLAARYPLEEIAKAQSEFDRKQFVGKFVLTIPRFGDR